ncbi:hypothetical protein [Rhodococcus sp. NPDC004095]
MVKTITISDEAYEFIQRTAHELETQNNRHTDTPIFRIYENQKVERRDGCGEHMARLDYEGAEEHWCDTCKKIWKETDWDEEALPPLGEEGCYCDSLDDAHWTYAVKLLPAIGGYDGVAFLTEKAAEEYREANHYHFTGGGVVYAESAFRNHELRPLIAVIKEIAKPEAKL